MPEEEEEELCCWFRLGVGVVEALDVDLRRFGGGGC